MTMWIILGVLIAVVVGFLVVTSVLDKRKQKKSKREVREREESAQDAIGQVAIWTNLVIMYNEKKLDNFVPSIGDLKMSDINKLAKDQLKIIRKSALFKKLYGDRSLAQDFETNLDALIHVKSNNWSKQAQRHVDFFAKQETLLAPEKLDKLEAFRANNDDRLQKLYKMEGLVLATSHGEING